MDCESWVGEKDNKYCENKQTPDISSSEDICYFCETCPEYVEREPDTPKEQCDRYYQEMQGRTFDNALMQLFNNILFRLDMLDRKTEDLKDKE